MVSGNFVNAAAGSGSPTLGAGRSDSASELAEGSAWGVALFISLTVVSGSSAMHAASARLNPRVVVSMSALAVVDGCARVIPNNSFLVVMPLSVRNEHGAAFKASIGEGLEQVVGAHR